MALPKYIEEDKKHLRHELYKQSDSLYKGDHYEVFNPDEQEFKTHRYLYICFGILKMAVDTKVDLIWSQKPIITFTNDNLQKEWDKLRSNLRFDEIMSNFTKNLYVHGDSVIKIAIDDTTETSKKNDLQLALYNISPDNWIPEYDSLNPDKYPKSQTFVLEKKIKENGEELEVYLLEKHEAGKIIWTAYIEKNDEYMQVPVLQHWEEELAGVLAKNHKKEEFELLYETGLDYSLVQFAKNKQELGEFYGKTDFSLPVISKLNSLNNYANLADKVIVTNTFPKLILSEEMGKKLKNIIEETNRNRSSNGQVELPRTFTEDIQTTFLSSETYLTSYIYRQLLSQMQAFVDGGRGETKYLINDFDLDQLRKQHEIFFKALMSEMGISEVFYNPNLAVGAKSGVALKRLASQTLNEIEHTKRQLEPLMQKVIYTLLQLGNQYGLITSSPEIPMVNFLDGLISDDMEILDATIKKIQNNLISQKEALKLVNGYDDKEAEAKMIEIQGDTLDNNDNQSQVANNNQIGNEQDSTNNRD